MDVLYLYLPLVLLVFYIITRYFLHKLQNLPPSPFLTLPLIGHLYLLKKPFHQTLSKISYQHGPVVFLWFGSLPILIVSSPSAAEECFTKNDIVFANRPPLLIGKYLGYNHTSLAWAPYGDHWRNLRRIASLEVLSSHRLQTLSHIRLEEVRTLICQLFRVSTESPDRTVDMKSALFELTFNVMTRMITGKRYYGENVENSEEAKRFQELLAEMTRVLPESQLLDFLPWMRWFGFRKVEENLIVIHEKRDKFMQNLIEEYRGMETKSLSAADRGRKKTIIEVLLSLHQEEPEYYTDDIIRSLMLVLLQAGTETTAGTMEWAFSFLLNNPEVLKKAQAEIDLCVGQDRLIDDFDVAKLPYLGCIINETLRMQPAAPLLIPHNSSDECMVGGFRIPRGTILLVNAWAIQHDPKIWVDPKKFKPERFEGLEGTTDGFKLMPFGSGRRGCPGESLARRVLGLALGSLIQCFDWENVREELIDMSEDIGFLTSKAQPLMAKCCLRPTMVNLVSNLNQI
ncbi:unnamed protein product [Ilex paraguariensis]|uniref:Cytochrome P450 n=1 Tax=Ilex paraguariensis TaxID=185542 RepID=A0ABC8UP65_9AQUA